MGKVSQHVSVAVVVELANGTRRAYEWTAGVTMSRAFGLARRWAVEQLRADKVAGRSSIAGMRVSVAVEPGAFVRQPDGPPAAVAGSI